MKPIHPTVLRVSTRIAATLTATVMVAQAQNESIGHGERSEARRPAGIPRSMPKQERRLPGNQSDERDEITIPAENRTIDGSNNNETNSDWGAAHQAVIRLFPNAYEDGSSLPSGETRPSAREVSNAIVAQTESLLNKRGASDFLWQWGQFLDHDIVETPTVDPEEHFDILIPTGDPYFDPSATGSQIIPLNRSLYEDSSGVREQINAITAYIDASNVYGSDETRAYALRRLDESGKLATTDSEHGELLPYNEAGLENAPSPSPIFFLAGDVRANEQVGLTALHTLFVREHNHWADKYSETNPQAMDEEIYQFARNMVAAEIQAITYREFLPVLLGRRAIPSYRGYDSSVRADISNEFGAAAYRIGHSLLSPLMQRLDSDGNEVEEGHLPLAQAFFNPALIEDYGIDTVLRGLAAQTCQELDEKLIDDVRNFLFGPPGSGGFDLAALNIQRGRDHGLPDYNTARQGLGLRPLRNFNDLTRDRGTREALDTVYQDVNQMDLWVAALCEKDVRGSMVGPVFQRILVDQFTRLRDGDRFFYLNTMPENLVKVVHEQTLAIIIKRNTLIGDELRENVFLTQSASWRDRRSRR